MVPILAIQKTYQSPFNAANNGKIVWIRLHGNESASRGGGNSKEGKETAGCPRQYCHLLVGHHEPVPTGTIEVWGDMFEDDVGGKNWLLGLEWLNLCDVCDLNHFLLFGR